MQQEFVSQTLPDWEIVKPVVTLVCYHTWKTQELAQGGGGGGIDDVEADEHALYKSSFFLNGDSGGCAPVVSRWGSFFLHVLIPSGGNGERVNHESGLSKWQIYVVKWSEALDFTSRRRSPQSSRIKRAQQNMPLKGIHPPGWSCCVWCLPGLNSLTIACLHACACITPVLVWLFQGSALGITGAVCLERRQPWTRHLLLWWLQSADPSLCTTDSTATLKTGWPSPPWACTPQTPQQCICPGEQKQR